MSASRSAGRRTAGIGIVVPVHNEEGRVGPALAALAAAQHHRALTDIECRLALVLDSCTDGTAGIVKDWMERHRSPCVLVTTESGSVGAARRIGCRALLGEWGNLDPRRLWLASTDADSEVPINWLEVQVRRHEEGYDFWAGRVTVRDWSSRTLRTAREWNLRYGAEAAPIHGANLGCNAGVYLDAGGFPAVRTGEDHALHRAVIAAGGRPCYDSEAPVTTSARRQARAPMGFSHHLGTLESPEEISA